MSFLAKVFGSKSGKEPTAEEAIQKLRDTEEMLQKRSDFFEKKVETEIATARKHGTKNKRRKSLYHRVCCLFLFDIFYCSCSSSLEEKKAIRKTAYSDRRSIINNRVSTRSS